MWALAFICVGFFITHVNINTNDTRTNYIGMPIEVANYLKNIRPIAYSNRHIQNIHSDVCGRYCLLFDYALEYKQMDDTYVEDFERFLNNCSDNTITNTKL